MTQPVPLDRFLGCVLGQAVGDALGAPFEGLPADHVYYLLGPVGTLFDDPTETLRYTDDTQMLIGVAETLIEHGAIEEETLCRHFVANFEPDRGYGQGARRILEAMGRPGWREVVATVFPGGSLGNGAAMRVAPVGLVFADDLDRVAEQARLSARVTHAHPLGIEGAELLAVAVALAARGPELDRREFYRELRRRCRSEEFDWALRSAARMRRRHSLGFLGNSLEAHRSVVTAIACFTTSPNSYKDTLERAITLGDDTDTLAAMAGALCGAYLGIGAIPGRWVERLEDGPRGGAHLWGLGERLHERYRELTCRESTMSKEENQTSGAAEIQVFELTMDNPEDQDELNRQLQKPGELGRDPPTKVTDET